MADRDVWRLNIEVYCPRNPQGYEWVTIRRMLCFHLMFSDIFVFFFIVFAFDLIFKVRSSFVQQNYNKFVKSENCVC